MSFDGVQYGDVATWFTAVATVAAVVAAVFAGRWARDIVEIERKRDERHEAETRALQASQVAAWAESAVVRPVYREGASPLSHLTDVAVNGLVANRSNQPIYKVHLEWFEEGELVHIDRRPVIAPGVDGRFPLDRSMLLGIAGVPEEQWDRIGFDYGKATVLSDLTVGRLLLGVRFTDSANRTWHRDPHGTLQELER
jgi:hypothetical protein